MASGLSKDHRNRLLTPGACIQIGVWVNVALTAFKLMAGLWGNSRALVMDAIHSASDVVATVVVWLAYRTSKRPADENHPYGHEGIQSLAAIFVSLLLIITAGFMAFSSIQDILKGAEREPSRLALYTALISIVIKEVMYRYTIWVGMRENSPALISNAWDHRSDAFSSVAAFLGILGARAGSDILDPAAGVVIALLIVYMAYKILRENVGMLIDEPPGTELFDRFESVIRNVEGVKGIGDFKMRRRGSMYYIDVTIYVSGDLTVADGHAIAETVEHQLKQPPNRIFSSMVHVEPLSIS